jgi:hypothetical protein
MLRGVLTNVERTWSKIDNILAASGHQQCWHTFGIDAGIVVAVANQV